MSDTILWLIGAFAVLGAEMLIGTVYLIAVSAALFCAALCGYLDADFNLEHSIETIMKAQDFDKEELIVCTDMVGGSVNNGFINFLGKYPFHLVSNVNLPFLIDLILSLDSFQDNTLETKVKEDVFGVKYINPMLQEWTNLEDV